MEIVCVNSIVAEVAVLEIRSFVEFQPVRTAVPPRPANAFPAASAATPVVYVAEATTVEGRAAVPIPDNVTVVEAVEVSALKNPTPLYKSDAPNEISVKVVGATEVNELLLTVAFATAPPEAVP